MSILFINETVPNWILSYLRVNESYRLGETLGFFELFFPSLMINSVFFAYNIQKWWYLPIYNVVEVNYKPMGLSSTTL